MQWTLDLTLQWTLRLLDFVSISKFAQYCNRCCNLKHSLPFEYSPKKLLFTWWALVASSLIRASLSSIARSHASFLGCFGCNQNSITPTPFPERNAQCKWLQTNAHKLDLEHSGLGRSSHIDRGKNTHKENRIKKSNIFRNIWQWNDHQQGEKREAKKRTQTLPVVNLLITSCELAMTKIMAEMTPSGNIDSQDIVTPLHFNFFFFLFFPRAETKSKSQTQAIQNNCREVLKLEDCSKQARFWSSKSYCDADPQTLILSRSWNGLGRWHSAHGLIERIPFHPAPCLVNSHNWQPFISYKVHNPSWICFATHIVMINPLSNTFH